MDSASVPAEPGASRPKRILPSTNVPSLAERESTSTASPDLGGTLVAQTSDDLAELSTDSDDDDGAASGSKRRKGKSKSNLPRRQIKIEYIQDKSRRNITFGKRKNGIFKKAQEISTLTGCEVMLIVAPKDSELQAYTYATTKLQPLVTEPASEAYIQNCLRYGMLMPGTPSGMTGAYGTNASNGHGSHISILRTGPRASPAPSRTNASHNPMYSYVHNTGMSRRPQAPYGLPHPLSSSPQSSASANTNSHTPQSVNLSDQCKRAASDSPIQHIGAVPPNRTTKQQWVPGITTPGGELHGTSPSLTGPNSVVGSSQRDILDEWAVAQPTNPFQVSSPLGTAPMSARGLSSFTMAPAAPGNGICYPNMPSENSPFNRQSPDNSIIDSAAWQPLSNTSHNLRTTPSTAGYPMNNPAMSNNGAGFLEPLVLSQPYDHRSVSSADGPLSSGPTQATHGHQVNMQSSLSQYGDSEQYENIGPTTGYFKDDGSESELKPYMVNKQEQVWHSGIH